MELAGKTAVITGGASGIGFATAQRLAREGANIVIGDIEEEPLVRSVAELSEAGALVTGVHCDVAVESDVVALREAALSHFGGAHLIFNNAGVAAGPAIGTPSEVWRWVMSVNVEGVIHGINAFAPLFLEQNEGHVVNTASLAGLGGVGGMGAYCASKFAVVGISETLFHEFAASGRDVHVSVLCPGFVRTRIYESERNVPANLASYFENPRSGEFKEIAKSVVLAGIDPGDVADQVAAAVTQNSFWILPHEHVALRTTEMRLEWMRGGPAPGLNLEAATQP